MVREDLFLEVTLGHDDRGTRKDSGGGIFCGFWVYGVRQVGETDKSVVDPKLKKGFNSIKWQCMVVEGLGDGGANAWCEFNLST